MEIDYNELKHELFRLLDINKVWILASSDGSRVSARAMSIIREDEVIYFQTGSDSVKYQQMIQNKHVALCYANVSIEGTARDMGNWEANKALRELYIQHHKGSYDTYGKLPVQVVMQVIPHLAVFWKYLEGAPVRDFLYLTEKKAERLFYLEQS